MYSDVRNVGFSVMKSQAIVYDQDLSAAPKDVPFLDIHDMRIKDVAPQKYYKSVKVTSRTGNRYCFSKLQALVKEPWDYTEREGNSAPKPRIKCCSAIAV